MGSGYRTFTAGEVLTASNVQNYLQDQAVMVFGGTAARSSAIGTANFEEGMLTYLTDVDKLQVYTGAAFADVYPAAATNQGLTLINTTSFSGVASQSVNDVFSATYDNYRILWNVQPSSTFDMTMRLRVAGADNSTSVYNYEGFVTRPNNTTAGVSGNTNQTSFIVAGLNNGNANAFSMDIYQPFTSDFTKYALIGHMHDSTSYAATLRGGVFAGGTSFTGFTFIVSGTMTGTVSVYGYNK